MRIEARRRRRRDRGAGPLRPITDIPFEFMGNDGDLYFRLACGHAVREFDYPFDENHIPIPDELAPGDVYLFACRECV